MFPNAGCFILAFGFASPWLLAGLVFAGIPVLIHLLHRRRYRETNWAAMRFLQQAARKHSRRLRLEQLILLAVRTLLLLLFVAALARPVMESAGSVLPERQPVHRILVVDVSFSMGYEVGDETAFDRAIVNVQRVLAESQIGDSFQLLKICGSEPRAVIGRPSFRGELILEELEQLQVSEERGEVVPTLQQIQDVLNSSVTDLPKEVYILSDFQVENWQPEVVREKNEIRQLLQGVASESRLILIDVGMSDASNSMVTRVFADDPFPSVGRISLGAVLNHFGREESSSQTVSLYIDDRLVDTKSVDLQPGRESNVRFSPTVREAGEHRLEFRLDADNLPIDNRRWMALPIRESLNVLLVNGEPAGRRNSTATHFLQTALSPATDDIQLPGIMRPEVINDGDLSSTDLTRYDCVFLCNVSLVTDREADLLLSYVENGGAVIISLGDRVNAENYNQRLYKDGESILPAKLVGRISADVDSGKVFVFDPGEYDHPAVEVFQGNPGTGLETAMTFEYVRAEIPPASPSRVALRFSSNDPAIIDRRVGRGRSILITTSLDDKWGTWAVFSPSFLPMMHELVQYAVAERWRDRQLDIGQTIVRNLPNRALSAPVLMRAPDGLEQTLSIEQFDEEQSVTYSDTMRSGVYELSVGLPSMPVELFAVNVDPRESDLQKLTVEQILRGLAVGTRAEYWTEWQPFRGTATDRSTAVTNLSRWLLLAALGLLFVEQLMAWRFRYGLSLLGVLIAVGLVQPFLDVGPIPEKVLLAGVVIAVVVVVGVALVRRLTRQLPRKS